MVRKRVIRWISAIILIILLVSTVISNHIYETSLPRVHTKQFEATIGELLDGYGLWETLAWVPRECIFPCDSEGKVCMYRILKRPGQFSDVEYYVEIIIAPVLEEREDAVLVDNLYLGLTETLICKTDQPLHEGETVNWIMGE